MQHWPFPAPKHKHAPIRIASDLRTVMRCVQCALVARPRFDAQNSEITARTSGVPQEWHRSRSPYSLPRARVLQSETQPWPFPAAKQKHAPIHRARLRPRPRSRLCLRLPCDPPSSSTSPPPALRSPTPGMCCFRNRVSSQRRARTLRPATSNQSTTRTRPFINAKTHPRIRPRP